MKPGARVKAEIVTADLDDALTVPRQAVGTFEGKSVVWRFEGGEFITVPVELGPSSVSRVVIASGLVPGDQVAMREPTNSSDNDTSQNDRGPLMGNGS